MRVECNRCGKSATIYSSRKESDSVKILYCSCSNPHCGHTFVMSLSFSHTLSPSVLDFPEDVIKKLQTATRPEQKRMFAGLGRVG